MILGGPSSPLHVLHVLVHKRGLELGLGVELGLEHQLFIGLYYDIWFHGACHSTHSNLGKCVLGPPKLLFQKEARPRNSETA